MSASSAAGKLRSRAIVLTLIASVGTLLSLGGFATLLYRESGKIRAELDRDKSRRTRALEQRFRFDSVAIYGLSRFVSGSKMGDAEDFRRRASEAMQSRSDICSVFWLSPSGPEAGGRLPAGFPPGISLSEVLPDGTIAAVELPSDRQAYPILHEVSSEAGGSFQGLDLSTVPGLETAVQQAVVSRVPVAAGCFLWPPGGGGQATFAVLRGVFPDVTPDGDPPSETSPVIGVACVLIRTDRLFEGAFESLDPGIDVQLYHGGSVADRQLVCAYDTVSKQVLTGPLPDSGRSVRDRGVPAKIDAIADNWWIDFTPTEAYLRGKATWFPVFCLLFGLLLTAVLTTYANTLLGRTHRVQSLVALRTAELEQTKTNLEQEILIHRRTEEHLARETFLLNTLLDHAPDLIYFKDPDSRFLRIGRALADYYGLHDPGEAIGKSDFDFFDARLAEQYRADEQSVMERGEPVLGKEEKQERPGSQTRWMSTSKVPLRSPDGEIVGTIGISRDITELKRVAEQLRTAKEAAEAANFAKNEFLANMSHEIRTPLNAVIGMTELVLDSPLEASQREYLKLVLESGESLLVVVNDILDFSKIEAGKLEFDAVEFDLRESVGDAVKSLAVRARDKGLRLDCAVADDVPRSVIGDAARLRQVLINLVGNAIKFTEAGEVAIEVSLLSRVKAQALVQFSVRDTGIGVPADKLEKIFQAFEQADTSRTRRYGGTGLGLTISSRLVELMGGQITVQSVPGQGSTFSFTAAFPVAGDASVTAAAPSAPSSGREHLQILLAEDSPVNQKLAVGMLQKQGHDVHVVGDGQAAVEAWRQQSFDLILMDVQMPEMDGLEATAVIRGEEADTDRHTPIIAMTAHAMKGDEERCLAAGMDGYVAKPIRVNRVVDAIERALDSRSTG